MPMRSLKTIRIVLSGLFFAAAVAYLWLGPAQARVAAVAHKVQILPSAIGSSMGVLLTWLALTFLFGRVYCSSVCPVGTWLDFGLVLRRRVPRLRRRFSYRPRSQVRFQILAVYVVCVVVGFAIVPAIIEPWSIMTNIVGAFHPSAAATAWSTLGIGMGAGIAGGIVSALLLMGSAVLWGREFCTAVCPIGTVLGAASTMSFMHIEIDPDRCINCMKCEDVCPASCVKVVGRIVDNSRCLRCFDCIAICPNDAIRFQINRNRRATPLFHKKVTGGA